MVDHLQSPIGGPHVVLKFGLDRFMVSEILQFLYFLIFGLNCLFMPTFPEFWGNISPK